MIQDLHTHTYYSFCSKERPEAMIEKAIASGVNLLGISDHNYSIGFGRKEACWNKPFDASVDYEGTLQRYRDHIALLRDKYAKKIKILCGIEVCTFDNHRDSYPLPPNTDISFFDYCLVENLDHPESFTKGDLFAYAKRCGCPVIVAHTDMFKFIQSKNEDPHRYFKKMAEQGIAWEINVNYDSLHNFRQHAYVTEFFKNKEQQEIVKKSGVRLSVGFDGHAANEYKGIRVQNACKLIQSMGIHLAFENR